MENKSTLSIETFLPLDDLHALGLTGNRVMAIDIGSKTLGLALNVMGSEIVTPLTTIRRTKYKNDFIALKKIIDEWSIKALIMGLPLNMDGSSGKMVQSIKAVAKNIAKDSLLPYCFEDERLSSYAAEARLMDIGLRPSTRKKVIDSQAACIILENYAKKIKKIYK